MILNGNKIRGEWFYVKKSVVFYFLLAIAIGAVCVIPQAANAALATGQPKFIGSMSGDNYNPLINSDPYFSNYFNQLIAARFWGPVEPSRGTFDWSYVDEEYNYAMSHGMVFKYHVLFYWYADANISCYPSWLNDLPTNQIKPAVDEFLYALSQRYPNISIIDVANELSASQSPPSNVKAGLGGDGVTGYDWLVYLYQRAKYYFPNAQLLYADTVYNQSNQITFINALKNAGVLDGLAWQGHFHENDSATTVTGILDWWSSFGLPIYISEFDLNIADDTAQMNKMAELFPVMYNYSNVKGFSFWGYREGQIWQPNAYLIRADGSERPAMTWLVQYMQSLQGSGPNLALNKTATASNFYANDPTYNAAKAVDGDATTRWATDEGVTNAWLEVDLGAITTFNKVNIAEDVEYGARVQTYTIQYWNGSSWIDAYSGTTIGANKSITFSNVTSNKIRLQITSASDGPTIYEFEVYSS